MSDKPMYKKEKIYLSETQLIILGTIMSLLKYGKRLSLYSISKHSNLNIETVSLNIDKLLNDSLFTSYVDSLIDVKKQKKDIKFDNRLQLIFNF